MITGTPWKKILSFSIPVFIGLLLQQLYNMVDRKFCKRRSACGSRHNSEYDYTIFSGGSGIFHWGRRNHGSILWSGTKRTHEGSLGGCCYIPACDGNCHDRFRDTVWPDHLGWLSGCAGRFFGDCCPLFLHLLSGAGVSIWIQQGA